MFRKNLISRVLYDFANSFFMVAIGAMFLAQWLILDNKIPDIRYGASFSLATAIVLIISPVLWAWSDKIGKRLPFLTWATIGLIMVNGIMWFVAVSSLPNKVRIVLGLSVVIQIFYQTSLIFYNALLKNVSQETTRGKIAGLGEALWNLWRIGAILVFLPFASWAITLMGTPGREQIFLPSFLLSTLFMLPMILWFKENKQPIIHATQNIYKKTRMGIKQLRTTQKNVWLYLLAFSLISDIVLTMLLYLAVVMDVIYKVNDNMKSLILVLFLIVWMICSYIFGKWADKFGYKKLLLLTCIMLIINGLIIFSCSAPRVLFIISILWWMASGWYFTITKAFMTKLSPPGELWEYFWLYSTFQKAASITAPLIRWGVTLRLIDYPVLKYRVAWFVMCGLLVIGTILMMKVKEK